MIKFASLPPRKTHVRFPKQPTRAAFLMMLLVTLTSPSLFLPTLMAAEVKVGPHSEKRVPIPISGPKEETLSIRPQAPYKLQESHIAVQDFTLWSKGTATPDLHVYNLAPAYSAQEFVHIDGKVVPLASPGGGGKGKLPPFHVTVPAVDLDWTGPGAPANETVEDTQYVWVTDQTNQSFVVRCPREIEDDMFKWHHYDKLPNLRLIWNAAQLEVFEDLPTGPKLLQQPYTILKTTWKTKDDTLPFRVSRKLTATPDNSLLNIRLERLSTAGDANSLTTYDEIKCKTLTVDLDVDSLGQWENQYFTQNFRTPAIDAIEEEVGLWTGKIVFVNNIDKDGDEIPDFMDGWSCPITQIPKLERELDGNRDVNPQEKFVPAVIEIQAYPAFPQDVRVKFVYPESKPETMTRIIETWHVTAGAQSDSKPAEIIRFSQGNLRLWKKDGNLSRNPADDFVQSDKVYSLDELGMSLRTPKVFYMEGVNASANWGEIEICAEVSLDSGATWIVQDKVRLTTIMSNFGICVVRQFSLTGASGTRTPVTPDYSSPALFLQNRLSNELETGKNLNTPVVGGANPWWHDGDATLGHGFAYVQYEGPGITGVSPGMFDSKHYWGKTGSGNIWMHGPGRVNNQSDLAWWDICPYKVQDKWLVLKQVNTLHPERLAKLNTLFSNTSRYARFGLDINLPINGWGCLSNVGLTMKDPACAPNVNPDIEGCYKDLVVPSTANEAVLNLLLAVQYDDNLKFEKVEILEELIAAIVKAATTTDWGDVASDAVYNTLVDELFEALKDKEVNGVTYQNRSEINSLLYPSRSVAPVLKYYDPGLFPSVFGENPIDKIDLRN